MLEEDGESEEVATKINEPEYVLVGFRPIVWATRPGVLKIIHGLVGHKDRQWIEYFRISRGERKKVGWEDEHAYYVARRDYYEQRLNYITGGKLNIKYVRDEEDVEWRIAYTYRGLRLTTNLSDVDNGMGRNNWRLIGAI